MHTFCWFWFVGVCMGAHKHEEINSGRNTTGGLVLETYKKKHEVKKNTRRIQ